MLNKVDNSIVKVWDLGKFSTAAGIYIYRIRTDRYLDDRCPAEGMAVWN